MKRSTLPEPAAAVDQTTSKKEIRTYGLLPQPPQNTQAASTDNAATVTKTQAAAQSEVYTTSPKSASSTPKSNNPYQTLPPLEWEWKKGIMPSADNKFTQNEISKVALKNTKFENLKAGIKANFPNKKGHKEHAANKGNGHGRGV